MSDSIGAIFVAFAWMFHTVGNQDPLTTPRGNPERQRVTSVISQPPTISSAQLGRFDPNALPRPIGNSYTTFALKLWRRSKSERARSACGVKLSGNTPLYRLLS